MVRGGPRRHGHLSLGPERAGRGLRRNIVDMDGTGTYKGKKHVWYKYSVRLKRKK